ncbi:hypothetical protein NP493_839g00005 [Ridgeia piscesae]|uniref:RING-type domain-containing protein n=1 Tax=Ridgeia piscesae TaxID=27915 RepID=A0AAD9NML9_RIDPI|nr:hypothetical protein NP493_839g00005 [Ridgeia piscesae]
MYVDHTLEMWMFFDVYGSTQAIRTCGIVDTVISPTPPPPSIERQLARLELPSEPSEPVVLHDPDECKVCMERRVDCVLTPCGHVVLCYECAFEIKTNGQNCPICRSQIGFVTKMYRA